MILNKYGKTIMFLHIIILLFICFIDLRAQSDNNGKLIVLIAVDGLSADIINKYSPLLKNGFNKLKDEGYLFEKAFVDHAVTVSHAGHVTLSTGTHPKNHGIVDAAFYSLEGQNKVLTDAVYDSTVQIVGLEKASGVSPRKILKSGISEWVKENDKNSKVLSVGSGNISSLLYNQSPFTDVFWYSRINGKYVTSTYYRNDNPKWIDDFNNNFLEELKSYSKNWDCIVPEEKRILSRKDSSLYEADQINVTFPHVYDNELKEEINNNPDIINTWLAWTPFLDEATLELAKRGIKENLLGQRNSIDYLSIVFSQVDNICHYYGANSLEALDVLIRIDNMIGDFINYLDNTTGRDNYVLALSSDHGFMDIPEYRVENGLPGKRITQELIDSFFNDFNNEINSKSPSDFNIINSFENLKSKYDFIAEIYSPDELNSPFNKEEFLRLYKNSYRADRVPRLPIFSLESFESAVGKAGYMIRLHEGSIINVDVNNHGSPYD